VRATGRAGDEDELERDLVAIGADAAVIGRVAETVRAPELPVLAEVWPTIQAFLAGASQWTVGPAGGVIGLNYQGVDIALRRLQMECTPEMWRGLQIMEATVVEEMAKRRE